MRGFIIVLDSFGIGYSPDAADYDDVGANTLKSISTSKYFSADQLIKSGLCSIDGALPHKDVKTDSSFARLKELSVGKDTTTGHWEVAGIVSKEPFPVFPNGFPKELLDKFEKECGIGYLCNKPYSGTKVIEDYGAEHLKTGKLIIYTSADSVFQIAAHEDIIPPEKLYDICKIARNILAGKYAVGRVIARPFEGKIGNFKRTPRRHDFSLKPPVDTMLDLLKKDGKTVISIGKIYDIFAHSGTTEHTYTQCNADGIEKTIDIAKSRDFDGICFTNLVDCDMLYGHRRDNDGYAKAISEFDKALPIIKESLNDDDFLIITADHGCDPKFKGTDHTREYVPLIIYSKSMKVQNFGTINGFNCIAKTVCDLFGTKNNFDALTLKDKLL